MKNTITFKQPRGLIDFLYTVKPQHDVSTKALVRRFKRKHKVLRKRYTTFLKSELLHPHLVSLSRDYEKLLFYVNELIFLNRDTNLKSSLYPISNVLEETALAIWSNEIVQIEEARLLCKKQEEYDREKNGADIDPDYFDDDDFEDEY